MPVLRFLLASLLALMLAACETNPATGQRSFSLLSPEAARQMGREAHPEVMQTFGGVYDDPEVQAYVAAVGRRIVAVSETPDETITFTVLNSDIVNAMALPGFVYVTRGLVTLANNEAELAGVLAHEIGHITGRHTAERYSRGVLAGLGATVLGAVLDTPQLADMAALGAQAWLQSFSREQEMEADSLGIRYLKQAGYNPNAMATFLQSLRLHAALEARLAGRDPADIDQFDFMATHPRTADRIREAMASAGGASEGRWDTMPYLQTIEGTLYGDDPSKGVVRDRAFLHPDLRFAFAVPEGFTLINGETRVLARHPAGAVAMFDAARVPEGVAMPAYVTQALGGQAAAEPLTISGLPAATAAARLQTQQGPVDLRLVAIRYGGDQVYRFLFLSPPDRTAAFDAAFRQTTFSFRPLSPAEAAAIRPYRVRAVQVQPGDSVESLARRLPYDTAQVERFRVLNGLGEGDALQPGTWVKVVE